jgi:hypothetical protein
VAVVVDLKQLQVHLLLVLVVVWDTDLEVELLEHRVKDFLEGLELVQQILLVAGVEHLLVGIMEEVTLGVVVEMGLLFILLLHQHNLHHKTHFLEEVVDLLELDLELVEVVD